MKTLFYGGTILTMADPLYAEALLVEDDKILAIGSKEELLQQAPDCEQKDLNGAVMMPGFVDPHSHFIQVANSLLQVSLNGADNPEEMQARFAAFIQENQVEPGAWLQACDYDNNLLPEQKNITLKQMDAMAPNNPVIVHHKSGHMGLLNTLALNKLGYTPETKAPAGGRIEVKDGKLTGYMEENAFIEAIKRVPLPEPAMMLNAMKRAQQKYASYGITTVQEGMVIRELIPMYQMLSQSGTMKLDILLYVAPDSYEDVKKVLSAPDIDPHIHVGGIKVLLDGSPQGRTAWMRQPYEGEAEYAGYGTMTDEALENAFLLAGKHNTQLLGHCNGDAAAEQYLRCLEKAEEKEPQLANLRPVIIHGQLMGRDQLPRAAKLGAMVSFFVAHVYHWGDVHLRNFGAERANHISAAKSALEAGVKFTFHQDAPVIEPDMLETVWCAVNRETRNGVTLGKEDEGISTLEALKAITVNGAYQYFWENRIGTLEPGKKADMVILDRDPLKTADADLREVQVLHTYKEGSCIYDRA